MAEHSFHIKEASDAKVFINKFELDVGTMSQIHKIIEHPSMTDCKIRIMPDCHRGVFGCVGLTSELHHTNPKICPNLIGVDIGCGICTYPIGYDLLDKYNLETIEETIRLNIPMGNSNVNQTANINCEKIIDVVCKESQFLAIEFRNQYKNKYNVDLNEHMPNYSIQWLKEKCQTLHLDYDYMLRSLGTLGGGNHFVELNKGNDNQIFLTIHCGSRCLGGAVCQYHQEKINGSRYIDWQQYENDVERMKRHTKVPKELKKYANDLRQELIDAKHTDYLELEEAYEYFFDMIFAQEFAKWNRRTIIEKVLTHLNIEFNPDLVIESIHNYVDFGDMIIRKGAVSAHSDKLCIIALNSRDGLLLLQSKYENTEWNYSAPHGCGRRLTREQAKSQLKLSDVKEQMKSVYSTTVVEETLEEAPEAYKNPNLIIDIIKPYFNILDQLVSLINVKGIN